MKPAGRSSWRRAACVPSVRPAPAPVLILVATDADDEWLGRLTEAVAERPGVEVRAAVDPLAAAVETDAPTVVLAERGVLPLPGCIEAAERLLAHDQQVGGVAVKLFDADGSLEAAGGAAFADGSVEGIAAGRSGSRAVARVRAPRRRRGRARRPAVGCGAAERAGRRRGRVRPGSALGSPVVERVGAALPTGRRRGARASGSGRETRSGRRHGRPAGTSRRARSTTPGAACWRAAKWELSDDPAPRPRLPDTLPRDRSRHGLSARGHVHTLAARARLVGDLPRDRDRRRAAARASPAAARDPDLRRLRTRRRESSPPASSTSPCSRSGSPLRGCFRSCARSRPTPAS